MTDHNPDDAIQPAEHHGEPFTDGGDTIQAVESSIERAFKKREYLARQQRDAEKKQNPLRYYFRRVALPWVGYGAAFGAATYLEAIYMAPYTKITPSAVNALAVGALALPFIRGAGRLGEKVGFAHGHLLNYTHKDRFNEITNKPRTAGAWSGFALGFILFAGPFMGAFAQGAADAGKDLVNAGRTAVHYVTGDNRPAPQP